MPQTLDNLIWILVGAVLTRILDKPIERFQRKVIYWFRGMAARFGKSNHLLVQRDEFRIGKWHTAWVTVEGSSSDPYTPNNVVCQLDPVPVVLPPERQQKKIQIANMQLELEKAGKPREYFGGPTVALAGIGRGQIGLTEEPFLVLRMRLSDYFTYLATTMSLDELIQTEEGKTITVRDKYLRGLRYESPIPEFVSAFAVNLNVITSDGFIVLSKRGTEGVIPYGGYISPAVNECVNPALDKDANGTVSLLTTAKRGASHELNIEITEDELVFFTLGLDTYWYSYLLTGLIRSKTFSRADFVARRSLGSKERWETTQLYFLPHDVESIAKFLRDTSRTEKWSPVSIVCLVQTMIHEFGTKITERALHKYPPFGI